MAERAIEPSEADGSAPAKFRPMRRRRTGRFPSHIEQIQPIRSSRGAISIQPKSPRWPTACGQHGLIQPILVVAGAADGYQLSPASGRLRARGRSRLDRSAGANSRGRRPPDGRAGDCRKPAAQGSQRPGKGRLVRAISRPLRLHAGGIGRPAEHRPFDDRQPDPPAGTARRRCKMRSAGGRITQGHARALLPLGDEREQVAFCERIQAEGLSVRATEQTVADLILRSMMRVRSALHRQTPPGNPLGHRAPAAKISHRWSKNSAPPWARK